MLQRALKPAIKRLAKETIRRLPVPLVRSYVRYSPLDFGKARLVAGYLDIELQRRPRDFVARVKGGASVAGTTGDLLQRHIYEFGLWEPNLTRWVRSRLRPGDVFVDVGANVGYFSLIGSRCVGPKGAVVAIEASPQMFELLRRNLRRNRLANVRAVNVAASDAHGSLRIHEGPAWNRGLATTIGPSGGGPWSRVRAMPIGDILSEAELRRARVVKIDVEGGEPAVVSGLLACLPAMREDLEIVVEIVPEYLLGQGKSPDTLVEGFQSRGYRMYRLDVDYAAASYVAKPLAAPIEWRGAVTEEADYIFSRGDPTVYGSRRESVQWRRERAARRRSRLAS